MTCPGVVHDAYAASPVDCVAYHDTSGGVPFWPFLVGAVVLIVVVAVAYGWHQYRT